VPGKNSIKNYFSLVKFSHTIFAMPFAIIGFLLGLKDSGFPFDPKLFFLIILCMIFARSAAMAFNRYADRSIDTKNSRTAIREIPSGTISANAALFFVILNCLLFIAATWFINKICFYLSPVALFTVLGYSYTKRFTYLCHVVLGVGLSLAPIGAYLAVTGQFALLPLLFSFAVLFWVGGFDVIYALQDEEFDRKENLKSIPVKIGTKNSLVLSTLFHLITACLIIYAGLNAGFIFWYWLGVLIFTGLLIYQHTLVKPNDLSKINIAFFTTNGIASLLLAVFMILELYL
jgi:4-hydroxybenzoate polyprenyltransferase